MAITIRSSLQAIRSAVALDDVSLEVPDGSLTALFGPSGGGKSTLLRVVAGLEIPDAGTVEFDGQDVTDVPVARPGHRLLLPALRPVPPPHGAPERRLRPRGPQAAQGRDPRPRSTNCSTWSRSTIWPTAIPSQLSGGQRQRMALARALAIETKLLLLDEPFGALDAQVRQELRVWLRELHQKISVTTVLVTHDQEEAMEVADHLAIINEGRLEQIGHPTEMYDHPANEFVMKFLGPGHPTGR